MANTNAFALKNSGLNPFLFADVGDELNGSPLTILSILARLEQDPWAEAARWAKLSKSEAVACLEQSIVQMPLVAQALADAHATAARLILLLPAAAHTREAELKSTISVGATTVPKWAPMAAFYVALAAGAALNMMLAPQLTAAVTTPLAHSVVRPSHMPTRS